MELIHHENEETGFIFPTEERVAILCGVPVVIGTVVIAGLVRSPARCRPVLILGVVEPKLDALLPALFGELLDWVTVEGGCVDDVEGIGLGVEHREAIVVLGCDDDVLHPRSFGQGNDVMSVEACWIEFAREGLVIGNGNGTPIHDPFADAGHLFAIPCACGNRVETPVNEHAKSRVAPPSHTRIMLRRGFRILDGFHMVLIGHVVVLAGNLGMYRDRRGREDRKKDSAELEGLQRGLLGNLRGFFASLGVRSLKEIQCYYADILVGRGLRYLDVNLVLILPEFERHTVGKQTCR